jgi:hypothetical protein
MSLNKEITGMDVGTAAGVIAALHYGTLESLMALIAGNIRSNSRKDPWMLRLANKFTEVADVAGERRLERVEREP